MQEAIVALIVVLAAAYAAWRWMPVALKRKAAGAIAGGSQRLGMTDEAGAQKLSEALSAASGCGACSKCAPNCATKGDEQQAR